MTPDRKVKTRATRNVKKSEGLWTGQAGRRFKNRRRGDEVVSDYSPLRESTRTARVTVARWPSVPLSLAVT